MKSKRNFLFYRFTFSHISRASCVTGTNGGIWCGEALKEKTDKSN
jgi:hypothetical protein